MCTDCSPRRRHGDTFRFEIVLEFLDLIGVRRETSSKIVQRCISCQPSTVLLPTVPYVRGYLHLPFFVCLFLCTFVFVYVCFVESFCFFLLACLSVLLFLPVYFLQSFFCFLFCSYQVIDCFVLRFALRVRVESRPGQGYQIALDTDIQHYHC